MASNYSPRYDYSEPAKNEAKIIRRKLVDHCRVLQRILVGKKAAYGPSFAEEAILKAVEQLAGELSGSMKIESEQLMTRKVADHAYTIGDMLMRLGSGMSEEYVRTYDEECLWNVIKVAMIGRSPYVPRI